MIDIGGCHLHCQIEGHGTPAVVMEAGIAASSLSWSLVQERVARFATTVSYDRAGFGWSEASPEESTAAGAARDLAVLLDRLGLTEPVILAGHSFGGLIVRIFQQLYPGRVAGLVLVDPVVRSEWRDPDLRRKAMLARGVMLSRRGAFLARTGVVGLALKALMSGSTRLPKALARASAGGAAGVAERLTAQVRKLPPELWPAVAQHWSQQRSFIAMANALENLPRSVDQLDEHARLGSLPIGILSASTSGPGAVAEHRRDAGLSTRSEHLVVPGTQHWVQLDAPDQVVEAIRRVIAGIRS